VARSAVVKILRFVSPHVCTLCKQPRTAHGPRGCPVALPARQVRANLREAFARSLTRDTGARPFAIDFDWEVSSR